MLAIEFHKSVVGESGFVFDFHIASPFKGGTLYKTPKDSEILQALRKSLENTKFGFTGMFRLAQTPVGSDALVAPSHKTYRYALGVEAKNIYLTKD
ncbi:MAG: hypothetical protein J6B24_00595, partial [Clostridia bacterium]|nr:hypothetical protein [Clostridia bacterium]